MLIIADSGSTKCTWIVNDGARTTTVRTRGINAVQHSEEQIRETLAELPPCGAVTAVRFYGAGCGATFPGASEKMRRELAAHFGTEDVTVESDLLGAARALFGRGEGIAASSAPAPTRAGAAAAKFGKTSLRWAMCWATRAAACTWDAIF